MMVEIAGDIQSSWQGSVDLELLITRESVHKTKHVKMHRSQKAQGII